MMEQKEFLNEETYQKAKKKIVGISLLVLVIGFLIGGGLIVFGIIKTNELKAANAATVDQIKDAQDYRTKEQVQADVDATQEKIDGLEQEISALNIEQNRIFRDDFGFSDAYYEVEAQIDAKEAELAKQQRALSEYKTELWKIDSGFNDTEADIQIHKNLVSENKYVPLFFIGGFVMLASAMVSGSVYKFAKRREIVAFQAQQIMPVAQEGITKMAPTVGKAAASMAEEVLPTASKAAGSIAKEVAKGIKVGMQDK